MTKKMYEQFVAKNGAPIAKSKMIAGNYIGRKLSDDLRIIAEIDGKWQQTDTVVECTRHLAFSTVQDLKNNIPVDISVPLTFKDLPVKTAFPFTVNDKGYTDVSLKKLSDSEVKALLKDEA